jgi:hypothetical protein
VSQPGEAGAKRGEQPTLAEKDINERVARLLARKSSVDDSRDVFVIVELLHVDRSDGVQDDDGVGAVGGNVFDESLSSMPEREVVAVALVAVDGDLGGEERSIKILSVFTSLQTHVSFSTRTVGEYEAAIHDRGEVANCLVVPIFEDCLDASDRVGSGDLTLKSLEGVDEVGEVGSA